MMPPGPIFQPVGGRSRRATFALLAGLAGLDHLPAATVAEDFTATLRASSPFDPSPGMPALAGGTALEFRGYVFTNDQLLLNLSVADREGRIRSPWISLGDKCEDWLVQSFDPDTESVVLEQSGQRRVLELKRGKIQLLAPIAENLSVTPDNVAALAAREERLERIREEVNRRRAVRHAALAPRSG